MKTFNPDDWSAPTPLQSPVNNNHSNHKNHIEIIVQTIEAARIDIAPTYTDWRDLGFALADTLGENGRSYYHRLSRFYSSYSQTETDKQFDKCLKAYGHGITIKTLFIWQSPLV